MNSIEMKKLVLVELEKAQVKSLFPQFSEDWVTDCSIFEATLMAPMAALLPDDTYGKGFGSVAWLAHHLAKATWKCQKHQDNGEILVQNHQHFDFGSVPAQTDLLCIKGMLSPSAYGAHHLEFKVTSVDPFQNITFVGRGTSTLHVYHPIPQATPAPPLPLSSSANSDSSERPHLMPSSSAPDDVPMASVSQGTPPPLQPSAEPKLEPSTPSIPQSENVKTARRSSVRYDPIAVSFRRRPSSSTISQAPPGQQIHRYSYINAHEQSPDIAKSLRTALAQLGITPMDVVFESMPTKTDETFIFSFSVGSSSDAQKIEQMIVPREDAFKIENLETSAPFFYREFSLKKVLKATEISHKYKDQLASGEGVVSLVEKKEHVAAAMGDETAMNEIRGKLSRRGRTQFSRLRTEILG